MDKAPPSYEEIIAIDKQLKILKHEDLVEEEFEKYMLYLFEKFGINFQHEYTRNASLEMLEKHPKLITNFHVSYNKNITPEF
jgi:hypothetical protein